MYRLTLYLSAGKIRDKSFREYGSSGCTSRQHNANFFCLAFVHDDTMCIG